MVAAIADKNGSAIAAIAAIAAIDGFHMITAIAAIAEWRPKGPWSNNIVRAIPQIQHGGCESSIGSYLHEASFLVIIYN